MLVPAYSANEKDSLNAPFKDRIAIHTNSVGWLLMTPNLGVEYSFIQNDFKKVSALLHGRYNPNSLSSYNPNLVYNIGGARGEVRWYWRTRDITEGEIKLDSLERAKYGAFKGFWKKLTTRPYSLLANSNPHKHGVYYIGPYLAFDKYTMKFFKTGYQGYSFGFGATAGYSIPLYHYKNGSAIDFELGFSAGFAMSMNDMFHYNADVDCYDYAGSKPFHFVPFPVVTDARVAFVYRMKSVREQLHGIDQAKIDEYAAVYELYNDYDDNIDDYIYPTRQEVGDNGEVSIVKNDAYIPSDSIKAWNKVLEQKNLRIREINRVAMLDSRVDSAMLLQELRAYYEYIEVPEKMFSQYNRTIPNKDVASIRELGDEYLNALLMDYEIVDRDEVKKETGLGQIEDPLLFSYTSLRSKLLEKNDSTTEIRLIDLMVQSVANVNRNIFSFNTKYNTTYPPAQAKNIEYSAMPVKMQVITGEAGKGYGLDFVFGVDSFTLAKAQYFSFKALNNEIEAENVYKQALLEELLDTDFLTKEEQAAKSKKAKKSKKEKPVKVKESKEEKESNDAVEPAKEDVKDKKEKKAKVEKVKPEKVKKEKKVKEKKSKKGAEAAEAATEQVAVSEENSVVTETDKTE